MSRTVRTTLVLAFLGGFVIYPALSWCLAFPLGRPTALKLTLWIEVALYTVFLVRWSRTHGAAVVLPLAILLGAAFWPRAHGGYYLILLGVWGWIRSGICFRRFPVSAIVAELVTATSGLVLAGGWMPHTLLLGGLGIWFFGLIQSLYFYIVPVGNQKAVAGMSMDTFDQAREELERVLDRDW